jgi:hypothetical protein
MLFSVTTSAYSVTITLDHIPGNGVHGDQFKSLESTLTHLGEVRVVNPVAVVSIIGRQLRGALKELGIALSALDSVDIKVVSIIISILATDLFYCFQSILTSKKPSYYMVIY